MLYKKVNNKIRLETDCSWCKKKCWPHGKISYQNLHMLGHPLFVVVVRNLLLNVQEIKGKKLHEFMLITFGRKVQYLLTPAQFSSSMHWTHFFSSESYGNKCSVYWLVCFAMLLDNRKREFEGIIRNLMGIFGLVLYRTVTLLHVTRSCPPCSVPRTHFQKLEHL